ncbi:MAG: FAD-binding oxidoreductase [Candidatus Gracilibacteria bacterium]
MIKNVEVIKGCISCRNCETVCPNIFKVGKTSEVISHDYIGNESEILQAELMCPVNVIKVQSEGKFTISFKEAILKSRKMLTNDVLEVTFETDNFTFKPGQYISLQMKDLVGKFSRSYSIAQADTGYFTLTIKLLNKGRGSEFVNKLELGNKIKFLGALGSFQLQDTKTKKVFVATGTGLAPMIAMLQKTPEDIEKVVIFGVRDESDIYYRELLNSFKNTKVIITISRPNDSYTGDIGRVVAYMNEIGLEDEVYICGNPEMIDSFKEGLIDRGHPGNLIFSESFKISRVYPGLFQDIVYNGNVPGAHIFSWFIIAIALFVIPAVWYYFAIQKNLYGDFIFGNTFSGFLWDVSWWSVVFVMAIRPLADLFPKIGLLGKGVSLRKAFGILSSSIVITILFGGFLLDINTFFNYFTSHKWALYTPFIGRLSEVTALILLLTSNTFSQVQLGIWWKRIQRLSYIYFISGGIIAGIYAPIKVYPIMGVVILLWILAQLRIKV